MRIFIMVLALIVVGSLASLTWLMMRGPSEAQAARIAAVLQSTAPHDEPPAYAHCASCHLHDGAGRPDGSIPRLAGQRQAVLENKLHRLRAGITRLPVMDPFARTLTPKEITEIATYLSALPAAESAASAASEVVRARGASRYALHCASCHGPNGEGHDGLFASRLCGQYAGYLYRRLHEIATRARGDADAIMQDAIAHVSVGELRVIAAWLAEGKGCVAP
jgi:cytochrome c553